ncbi:MAG TPA: zeta toxin family protein [Firmicutes bacterium]|nr:zeta toxin family protein [Bacillota bacterium]
MGKLIIIRGNSGSGKTSLAKLLQKKLGTNTLRISHDMIRMELLNVCGREGVERSEPLMTTLLRYGKANSEVTILEGILPTCDYSHLFESALTIFGADIYAYYYDLPFDETLRRHMTNIMRSLGISGLLYGLCQSSIASHSMPSRKR